MQGFSFESLLFEDFTKNRRRTRKYRIQVLQVTADFVGRKANDLPKRVTDKNRNGHKYFLNPAQFDTIH